MKIGRNEPCPCGSGKKYKRCCLSLDEARGSVDISLTGAVQMLARSSGSGAVTGSRLSPYAMAKLVEESEGFAKMKRNDPARAALFWTPSRMSALETSEIAKRLQDLGLDATQEAFVALAENTTSAWEVSEQWRQKLSKPLSKHEDDFLLLAAVELWKRYLPGQPSEEMIDDWMQEGYTLVAEDRTEEGLERWQKVWDYIRSRLSPEMRTCGAASDVFDGTQMLYNWIQDFELEVLNAALDEKGFAEMGARLCREVLERFPDEDELFVSNFRADLGEFLYLAGRPEEGERALRDLIHDRPDESQGYARLADMLAYGGRKNGPPLDLEGAIRVLEEALARPTEDADDFSLDDRLDELKRMTEAGIRVDADRDRAQPATRTAEEPAP